MKCIDEPTADTPIMMPCVECDGGEPNCRTCGGDGMIAITRCPKAIVGSAAARVIRFIDMAENRTMPEAGGLLDQSEKFLQASQYMQAEDRKWQAVAKRD